MKRFLIGLFFVTGYLVSSSLLPTDFTLNAQQPKNKQKGKGKAQPKAPAKPTFATPGEKLNVAKDFKVELLYSVPKDDQGSWVAMCTLPSGNLIVSDQYGALYEVTPPAIGADAKEIKIEKVAVELQGAQGLLWAFDSLYVMVNSKDSGLYRVTDSDNDGKLDKVETLRKLQGGGGEHGPHAILPHPDGKRLTIVCGNQTKLTEFSSTCVPPIWGDDHLLPRMRDGRGFMAGVLAPGGSIYHITPDGKDWELYSTGYRNQYDAAYDPNGNLFTYDADMEWDANTPWYRPTRVCLATSGSDFGWRNGAGKYLPHYPDNLPGICDIGPGSPTGVAFGTGAKFPAKYQRALFICDWSYGKMYAVHMKPDGSAYKGTAEEFISGTPLPLTDLVVNPKDGALYFATGGRRTQSGLYRVTYTGAESTVAVGPEALPKANEELQAARKEMESLHLITVGQAPTRPNDQLKALMPKVVDNLGSTDRFLQFSARTALEQMKNISISEKLLEINKPSLTIQTALALTRRSLECPLHVKKSPDTKQSEPDYRGRIFDMLMNLDFAKLSNQDQIDFLRTWQVFLHRAGDLPGQRGKQLLAKLDPVFPTGSRFVDTMLCEVLVYLQSDTIGKKAVAAMLDAPTQEEQMEYARHLRMLKAGWTPELQQTYFAWFVKAYTYKGGNSFGGFIDQIKVDALKNVPEGQMKTIQEILATKPDANPAIVAPPRPFVKKYTMADLEPILEKGLAAGQRDFDKGRKLFAAANCFSCHRYDNEGGANGPDLTGVAGRFSPKDLLESILDPNKEISDQYAAVDIATLDGKVITGRIVNLSGDRISVNVDMLNPNGIANVNRQDIDVMKPSKQSMMPAGLLDTFQVDEVLDLLAYTLSRGNRTDKMFKK